MTSAPLLSVPNGRRAVPAFTREELAADVREMLAVFSDQWPKMVVMGELPRELACKQFERIEAIIYYLEHPSS